MHADACARLTEPPSPTGALTRPVELRPESPVDTFQGNSFEDAAGAQMERIVRDMARLYRERNEALEEVARAHHEALLRLAVAAEYKDEDTGVHMVRIGFLSELIALLLGEDAEFARLLRLASPMHDVGKIGIPDAVLKKPGPLDPQERGVMQQHAMLGAELLGRSRIPVFRVAAEVALMHHERWDGTGYPNGLRGNAIPLSGRIVAVADFLDALTMDRVYRPAFSVPRALTMLASERGRAFDPAIVAVVIENAMLIDSLRRDVTAARPEFSALQEADPFNIRGRIAASRASNGIAARP